MTHYCERCNREILPDERTFHSERDRFCLYCRRYNAAVAEADRLLAELAAALARAEAAEARARRAKAQLQYLAGEIHNLLSGNPQLWTMSGVYELMDTAADHLELEQGDD